MKCASIWCSIGVALSDDRSWECRFRRDLVDVYWLCLKPHIQRVHGRNVVFGQHRFDICVVEAVNSVPQKSMLGLLCFARQLVMASSIMAELLDYMMRLAGPL